MLKIITIDGPASSGKGTIAKIVATKLGFDYLDSGAIYRSLAILALEHNVIDSAFPHSEITEIKLKELLSLVSNMTLSFIADKVMLNGNDISVAVRGETVGLAASNIAKIAEVRAKLLDFQRNFAKPPGLVTDGRDMGSVVFPNADLKIYLTSDAKVRAERRAMQLQTRGIYVKMTDILADIEMRDLQDKSRKNSPLVYDNSYKVLDNSDLTIDATVDQILRWFK